MDTIHSFRNSPTLISFPNAKINLGLNVTRKRQDGYHDIATVFYPLPLSDVLEVVHDDRTKSDRQVAANQITFTTTGLPINGAAGKNLCIKAYELLQKDFPQLPAVQIFLHKVIPIGAGLGGGSSDGSFTLKLINEKFRLQLPLENLLDYALQLGSDCPFFILNKPCFATGRGEFLQAIELDLTAYSFIIVNPGIHINTAWAFEQLEPHSPEESIQQIIQSPISKWKTSLTNDFEQGVFVHYPQLSSIKSRLYECGAIYASLSGSGSCFYGIFLKNTLPDLHLPDSFQIFHLP